MRSKTILKWKMPVVNGVKKNANKALVRMATDIANEAGDRAPYVTGNLSRSVRVVDSGDKVLVVAGGQTPKAIIDYALKREIGPNRNPATVGYMSKSFTKITTGDWQKKYFGGITK